MDARLSLGDKMELVKIEQDESEENGKRKMVYGSQIVDELKNGEMMIAMPVVKGQVIPLSVGDSYRATFFAKKALFGCDLLITNRYKKDSLFILQVSMTSELVKQQRREFFRLDCRISMDYRMVSEHEDDLTADEIEQFEWKQGVILDLSAGGVRFVSPNQEEKGTLVQVKFVLVEEEEVIRVTEYAKILRSEMSNLGNKLIETRLEFQNITDADKDQIIKYIFHQQRIARSKGKA